jgi:hypothetical protein
VPSQDPGERQTEHRRDGCSNDAYDDGDPECFENVIVGETVNEC